MQQCIELTDTNLSFCFVLFYMGSVYYFNPVL